MTPKSSAIALLFLVTFTGLGHAQDRYPYRVPDWLLGDERYAPLISREDNEDFRALLKEADDLRAQKKDHAADLKDAEANTKLAGLLALRDLTRGAAIVSDQTTGRRLAVHLDPTFPADMGNVLLTALQKYMRYATNDRVVADALNVSVEKPEPFPAKTVEDSGKQVPNPMYVNYLQSIPKPESVQAFTKQLTEVLQPSDGSMPLIVISAYSGNPWWGGGFYDFYNASNAKLTRLTPKGFLYIRLNTDKMTPASPRWNDSAFWASKIAHEVLHNLGYWHPGYADPAERDKFNQGNSWVFLVAYETKLLEAAEKRP